MNRIDALIQSATERAHNMRRRRVRAEVLESAPHVAVCHDRIGGRIQRSFFECRASGLEVDVCDCDRCDVLAERVEAASIAEERRQFAAKVARSRATLASLAPDLSDETLRLARVLILQDVAAFQAANPRARREEVQA